MKTFLCLLLVIVSFLSYPLLSPHLSFYQYHPMMHYLGMVVGIILLIRMMVKEFTKLRLTAAILSVLFVGCTLWYTLSFSEYPDTKATIKAGDVVDERLRQITLVSSTGEAIKLGEVIQDNRATLIVFSRGKW